MTTSSASSHQCPIQSDERLERIEKALSKIGELTARIDERQQNQFREIFGNGKRGLLGRVDDLEKAETRRRAIAGVVAVIVSACFSLLVTAVKFIAR